MSEDTMLYRAPGPHKLHGHDVEYVVVDAVDVDGKLGEGWFRTPTEAGEAKIAADKAEADRKESEADDNAAATREEVEQKLTELNVVFDRRLGTKKLTALLEETLKARQG